MKILIVLVILLGITSNLAYNWGYYAGRLDTVDRYVDNGCIKAPEEPYEGPYE